MRPRARWWVSVLGASSVVAGVLATTWWDAPRDGYVLFGDAAVIALRAGDVFGAGSPLLGMPSAFSAWSNAADPMHPGPAVFWLLAPTMGLIGGTTGALLGTFLVMLSSALAVIALVTRRMGAIGAPLGAALVLAAIRLGPIPVWEPLNPTLAVPICIVVAVSVWGILDGDDRSWPFLVVAASVVIQLDLSFLPSTTLMVLAAAIGTALRWRGDDPNPDGRRRRRRTVAVSVGLLLVLWALPIGDALVNQGGNVAEGFKALGADIPVRGLPAVLRSLMVSFLPAVLVSPLLVVAWRADRPARRALLVTGAIAGVGAAIGQGLVPAGPVASLVWVPLSVNAVVAWFSTAVAAGDVALRILPNPTVITRTVCWALLLAVAVRLGGPSTIWGREYFPSIQPISEAIRDEPAGDYRLQPLGGPMGVATALSVMQQVDGAGARLLVDEPLARYVGGTRLATADEPVTLYLMVGSEAPPVPGAELIARWRSKDFDPSSRRRIDSQVAEAVRRSPVVWSPSASSFFVASIAAPGSGRSRHRYDTLALLGEDIMAGKEDIGSYPDDVLAELVAQQQVMLPESDLLSRLRSSRAAQSVSVWVVT